MVLANPTWVLLFTNGITKAKASLNDRRARAQPSCTAYRAETLQRNHLFPGLARTVYMHRIFGEFPAKKIVYTPYV
jgi:hypothetical protein